MPRYLVERTFPNGLQIPVTEEGRCRLPRRGRSQRGRRRDLDPFVCERGQEENVLYL